MTRNGSSRMGGIVSKTRIVAILRRSWRNLPFYSAGHPKTRVHWFVPVVSVREHRLLVALTVYKTCHRTPWQPCWSIFKKVFQGCGGGQSSKEDECHLGRLCLRHQRFRSKAIRVMGETSAA